MYSQNKLDPKKKKSLKSLLVSVQPFGTAELPHKPQLDAGAPEVQGCPAPRTGQGSWVRRFAQRTRLSVGLWPGLLMAHFS